MTRANAANGDVCPDMILAPGDAALRIAGTVRGRFGNRPLALAEFLRARACSRHIPTAAAIGVVFAVVSIVALTLQHLWFEREMALRAAAREVAMRATILATRLDAALSTAPHASPAAVFRRVLEAHPDERLAEAILIDRFGRRIAIDAPQSAADSPLMRMVGGMRLTAPGVDRSGVVRVSAGGQADQFAAVRSLPTTAWLVAFASPVDVHLAAWRATARATVLLLASTVALMVAAGAFFAAEVRRKRKRARAERTRRARIDLALNRGRCGLWTWDLERGRIVWSASMFEILALGERCSHWSIADLQTLMHPEDQSLETIGRTVAEGRGDCVDVEFRMRAADGRWVWLRKRAEMIEDEETGAASLVGIVFDVSERKREVELSATADQRLRDAIEAISEAFVLRDSSNRLVLCNSKYRSLINLRGEAFGSGASPDPLAASGDAPVIAEETAAAADAVGLAGCSRTYEAHLADGRWLQVNERRTRDGGYVSVGADITALKQHEAQLVELEATSARHDRPVAAVAPLARGAGSAARRSRRSLSRAEGPSRGGQSRQGGISGQHESRAAHAAQCDHRIFAVDGEPDLRAAGIAEIS